MTELQINVQMASAAVTETANLNAQLQSKTKENKKLQEDINRLAENFNAERVLRKKYYNMVNIFVAMQRSI